VRSDGAVVNKVGTRTLALVAQAAGKPVYALAERLKVTPDSYPLVIEEMNPAELLPQPISGVLARNIYFDVTPARLILHVITESGPTDKRDIALLAVEAERAYRALMAP
jgi:translation initiation factor 2B subunit (eIF-2B alpha/beta/delta family)